MRKIENYMRWAGSKKGYEFWEDVYYEFLRIAETGEP